MMMPRIMKRSHLISCLILLQSNNNIHGFTLVPFVTETPTTTAISNSYAYINTSLGAKKANNSNSTSKGFGKSSSRKGGGDENKIKVTTTYGKNSETKLPNNIIDMEGAMANFFTTNEEWHPLFHSLISYSATSTTTTTTTTPALDYLPNYDNAKNNNNISSSSIDLEYTDTTPWKKYNAIPTNPKEIEILSKFLDSTQQALLEIPVENSKGQDSFDLHFIEEGRRILVCNRFQVLESRILLNDNFDSSSSNNNDDDNTTTTDNIDNNEEQLVSPILKHDDLFRTCWSEISTLLFENQENTGSLIILPDYYDDMNDLARFTDMHLLKPLEWMGLSHVFEVSSLMRGSPAIRLLHKLSDVPSLSSREN